MIDDVPVRWSLKTHQRGWGYPDTLRLWRLAEAMEFHAVFLNDHLYGESLESWSLLSALFAQTTRIRGGTMVTSTSFRHPSILAKMATTVDIVSGGRLSLGLGAGNEAHEYRTYGLDFLPPAERVDRLEETCQVLEAAWAGDPVTWQGAHFRLEDATFAPRPVQRPHPYLIIGVKQDRGMGVAVRHADEWNWNRRHSDTSEFLERMDRLDALCEAAGRDPASLPRGVGFRRLLSELEAGSETLPHAIEMAQRCIRRGADHVVLMVDRPEDLEREVEFLRTTFIPAVHAGL